MRKGLGYNLDFEVEKSDEYSFKKTSQLKTLDSVLLF